MNNNQFINIKVLLEAILNSNMQFLKMYNTENDLVEPEELEKYIDGIETIIKENEVKDEK